MNTDHDPKREPVYPVETIHIQETPHQQPEKLSREPQKFNSEQTGPKEKGSDENRARLRGKLKVYFSYAPGVGKTLAMLKDAHRRLQEGVDVVVGYVDVHGDSQVMQLLEKFEILPQFMVTGSGLSYKGMNLNKILARQPQLVLVDQLAQANPPGLRHEKRYLEVDELLRAGIDVYTTLNVFEMESQVDTVAYLTGMVVRETVNDHFLDGAEQIEMVDMPPQELMQRYHTGMVYIPLRLAEKMDKYFQLSYLFGMRELALRYVALRSKKMMRSYLQGPPRDRIEENTSRLLVCIDASPESARMVRAGRRMADETHADWVVIYVETPAFSEDYEEKQAVVAQNMRLAELLGAQTITLSGRTVAEVVAGYAQKHHITQVLVGQPARRQWLGASELLFRGMGMSLAEQVQREDPTLEIYTIGKDQTAHLFQQSRFWTWVSRMQVLTSLVLVAIPTLLGLLLTPTFISRSANVVMLYLVSIVVASLFLGLFPSLLTAALSAIVYDFFFIPPLYQLFGFAPENTITYISLLVVSFVISTLMSRERALTRAAQRRADQISQLYDLSRDLAAAVSMPDVLQTIVDHVQRTFDREAVVLLPDEGKLVLSASSGKKTLDVSELTAAEWAYQQGRPAGHNTGTFSYASYRYFPLETSRSIIGVLGVRLAGAKPDLYAEQVRMLSLYVTKATASVERALYAEEASQAEILRVTEKLQSALLNSISHDLRTPLASITGVLSSLRLDDDFLDAENRRELVETAYGEAERLNRLVGNLLDMSRLESGMMKISRQLCDMQDLIGSSLLTLSSRLEGNPVKVDISPGIPLVAIDYVLIQQVIINLLDNAVKYSPEGGPIRIALQKESEQMSVSVEDSGPGIPEEDVEHVFEKFYRVKRFENVVGTGLGLSICKGIVEVHGGKIWAENRQEGGLRLTFTLPVKPEDEMDQDAAEQELPEEIRT